MAKKRITSRPGLFGIIYYYDEDGKLIAKSRPGLIKGTRVYTDPNGKQIAKSRPGVLCEEVFVDCDKNVITSYNDIFGSFYMQNGKSIGRTKPWVFGSSHTSLETDDEFCDDEFCEDEFYDEESYDDESYDELSDNEFCEEEIEYLDEDLLDELREEPDEEDDGE